MRESVRSPYGKGLAVALAIGALGAAAGSAEAALQVGFSVDGSKNHEISFNGRSGDFAGASVSAAPNALNKGRNVAYSLYEVKDSTVTAKRLKADFGPYGEVDARFKATGEPKKVPVPKGCTGKPGKWTKGKWMGTMLFEGEGGYSDVDADSASGYSSKQVQIESCNNPPGGKKTVALNGVGPGSDPAYFGATKTVSSGKVLFFANWFVEQGKVSINRLVNRVGTGGQFSYNQALTQASVSPPPPFSGSASVTKEGSGEFDTGPFAGSFEVDFPGAPNVPLAGPGFTATLRNQTF